MKDRTRVIGYRPRHKRYSWVARALGLAKPRPTSPAPLEWEW